jgi:hypothetical protein
MTADEYETPSAAAFIASREKALVGRRFQMKDIGRAETFVWRCEAVTLLQQTNHPKKVAIVMRLELETAVGSRFHGERVGAVEGSVEYRIGYYIVNRKGRWHWGQYALMIPAEDLRQLFAKALDEGTIRPADLSLP